MKQSISPFAAALQGRDFQCVLSPDMKKDEAFIKMLADRAASMVTTATGMRSGKALKTASDDKLHYWIYTWDIAEGADIPLFFMTHDEAEYTQWRDRFINGPKQSNEPAAKP